MSPVSNRHNTRKDKLLEVSLKLIHQKGFKAVTMRDIADEMKFEPANIYKFIDSKQGLLESLIFSISDEFHNQIDLIMDSGYSSIEKLREVVSLHVRLTSTRPYEVALLVNEWRNLTADHLKEMLDRRKMYEEKIKQILEQGMASGEIRTLDSSFTMNSIMAMFNWLYNWYIEHTEEVNPVELEKQICDFIFQGVRPTA